ncbi:pilus assembly protein CpaE [Corynebacterium felinum]|uniref:Secretion/DNA translocation related CpaE-like protein n=1 Tax=Corynebacterium felinum TaxID=131318 RepID=A0ABU2B659_9CORY|nr:septum site-determining protein Ssd [Corynebacterium felinum]MDF5820659.1 pilus assembly protein CpaE [Corynebacterium felinum]MDR7354098.1 secretion/DNA translocation related CpaE-like protein [Corynebacterium felinum]WJY96270.1 hypothetical protein CFELI_13455 [Corynebacterium felinum]
MTATHILIAVTDPGLHPEAINIAAASGLDVFDTTDPRDIARFARKAQIMLVDAVTAHHAATVAHTNTLFILFPEPGPLDTQLLDDTAADGGFFLPAQANDLLKAIGEHLHSHKAHTPTSSDQQPHTSTHAHKRLDSDETRPMNTRAANWGKVLCVSGAVGGAGASTFAAALALAAHKEHPTVLIEADPNSGGIDLLVGIENTAGLRWNDMKFTEGSIDGTQLFHALPHTAEGLAVLSIARNGDISGITEEGLLIAITALKSTYTVVIDMPNYMRFFSTVAEQSDCTIILIPAEVRAAAAAARVLAKLRARRVDTCAIMRHRGWSGLRRKDLPTIIGCPVAAEVFLDKKLPRTAELTGLGNIGTSSLPKSLTHAVRTVLEET